jgi:predicted enzyme related to lactoylglutathione lyase
MGVIQDNVGALVRLWQSAPEHGTSQSSRQGHMNWNELATKEPEKAARFYEAVLGVKVETVNTGADVYRLIIAGGKPVAGILQITPEMGDFPSSWNVEMHFPYASCSLTVTRLAINLAFYPPRESAVTLPCRSQALPLLIMVRRAPR